MKDSWSTTGARECRRAIALPAGLTVDQQDALFWGFNRGKRLSEVAGTARMAVLATKAIQHRTLASWT
jgi:hypothetical protein